MATFLTKVFSIFSVVFVLLLVGTTDADAKRLGGGKSFGSKPAYSSPYQQGRPSVGNSSQSARQQVTQSNQPLRDSFARRGGLGGMLGGLLIGGILGSMLFGGAFEGLNFADILIFGLIAFLLYRLFASRRSAVFEPIHAGGSSAAVRSPRPAADAERASDNENLGSSRFATSPARFNTDLLFERNRGVSAHQERAIPGGFNESHFLSGARSAYRMLQEAWDKGDLSGLRLLTTDQIFRELQSQLNERVGSNLTRILDLNSELLEVKENAEFLEAAVLFIAELEEEASVERRRVSEVWHFVQPVNAAQPTWFLDGIQQVE